MPLWRDGGCDCEGSIQKSEQFPEIRLQVDSRVGSRYWYLGFTWNHEAAGEETCGEVWGVWDGVGAQAFAE